MRTISFIALKGGSGKTMTSGTVAYLLSRRYKVLAIDMDPQGNLSQMLSKENIYTKDQYGRTMLDAILTGDVRPYIRQVDRNPNLHFVLGNDAMSRMPKELYRKFGLNDDDLRPLLALKKALTPVSKYYQFCVIDTPPRLGEETLAPLLASNGTVIMFEPSTFSYNSLPKTLEIVNAAKRLNKKLQLYGILPSSVETIRYDHSDLLTQAKEELPILLERVFPDLLPEEMYQHVLFKYPIKRRVMTGRLTLYGFNEEDNPELVKAVEPYGPFLRELTQRMTGTYLKNRRQADEASR